MDINTSGQDKIVMELHQLGATVQTLNGIICYISFMIENTKVTYLYNINKKKQYFLQRISPYPLSMGAFNTEKDIISFISADIKKFEYVSSHNCFQRFIDLNLSFQKALEKMEHLFIRCDMSEESFEMMEDAVENFNNTLSLLKVNCDENK